MGRQTYFAAVLLLLLFGSNAQAFRLFHHLAVKDGLPSYQTYVVAQDKQGLIWVGTENGLARYDGYKIKVYQHSPSNATSLSANVVRCLLVDSYGRLWVGTDGGLDLFDAKHDSFLHITSRAKDLNGTSASSISALAETRTGNILVGTNGDGLIFLDRSGKIIKHYRHDSSKPSSLSNNSVRALYVDKDNSIWIGTRNGLNKFDRNKDYFQHYSHTKSTHSLSNNNILAIVSDGNDGLWVGTFSGLNHMQHDTSTFIRYAHKQHNSNSLPNDFIHALLLDKNNNLWISTYLGGISKFNPVTSSFSNFNNTLSDPYSISDSDTWGLMLDSTDTLWIATDSGISFTNLHDIPLTYLQPSGSRSDITIASPPNILLAYHNYLLIGVDSGLDVYNLNTGKIEHRDLISNSPTKIRGEATDTITAITVAKNGRIWLGTLNGDLLTTELNPETHDAYKTYNASSIQGSILAILQLSKNLMLLATTSGQLITFNLKTLAFDNIDTQPDLHGAYISLLETGLGNTLIVGANSGLYIYTLSVDYNSRVELHLTYGHQISNFPILSLYKENPTSYWIGTPQGLQHYCSSSQPTEIISCKGEFAFPLPSLRIKGIAPGIGGDLWLSTSIGLYDYDPKSGIIKHFGIPQGLPFDNFFERMYTKTDDNRIWFGGSEGVIGFNPTDMHVDTTPPSVLITSVSARGGNSKKQMEINKKSGLSVHYDDRNLIIDYTVLDYASPDTNVFSYRLIGFDTSWIDAGNSHQAVYTNISPGHYQFAVRGANNWGTWSTQPAVLNIVVLPPWWRTWWAYVLYTLLILSGMFAYVHTQQRKLRREREISAKLRDADAIKSNFVSELETQVSKATGDLKNTLETVNLKNQELEIAHKRASEGEQLKSQFLANMSHELRTPLTAILGYLKLLLQTSATTEQAEYLRTVQHSSESLLAIINDTLDLSRIESGKLLIDEVDINLLDLIESTVELLGPSAYLKHIALLRIIPPEIPLNLRGDPLRIRQILTNLVGNAIKFTQSGSVCIRVQEIEHRDKDVMLGIAISDTGIGIPVAGIAKLFNAYARHESAAEPATEGTGLGLSICKKLLDLMGGEIEVLSTPGVGSTFEFRLTFRVQKQSRPQARFPDHVKIALLDNHPLSHQAWRASLARLGLDVVSIRNAISLKEHDVSALITVFGPEDIEIINDISTSMEKVSIPHLLLAPTAERRMLDLISEACKCRTQNTLIRESVLLSELRGLIPLSSVPNMNVENRATSRDIKHDKDDQRHLILVADDNAINRKLLVTILLQNGYRVAEASSGKELLALAEGEPWDAVLVDVHMPDMDGMEATRKLLSMQPGIQAPIIAVSADALPDTRASALAAGMRDYLVKPYSEEQLLDILQRYLQNT